MDLTEAGQRIFRRHWALILIVTLVGLAVPLAIARLQTAQYVATARIDFGVDVRGSQEANSLADSALAVATSPAVMSKAIAEAKVHAKGGAISRELQVVPVGTSGVLELSVTDPDKHVAGGVANALAADVVQVRLSQTVGGTQQLLNQTQQQYAAVAQQIGAIEQQIQAQSQAPAFTTSAVQARSAALSALTIEHSTLLSQQSALDRQRQQLTQTLASTPQPAVVDASQKTGSPVVNSMPIRLVIGGLLGLLVGVMLAAVREALRPTLDLRALARRLRAPLLGRLSSAPDADTALEDPWLVSYLTTAATTWGVRTVQLVPVGRRPVDVSGIARSVDGRNGLRVVPLLLPGSDRAGAPSAPAAVADAGIVVVAPKVVKGNLLRSLERHLGVTRQRVIGVIGYRGRPEPAARTSTSRDETATVPTARESIPAGAPAPTASTAPVV